MCFQLRLLLFLYCSVDVEMVGKQILKLNLRFPVPLQMPRNFHVLIQPVK